jgi:glycosyltransferase involved in cell wall biosynthesis
LRAGRWAHDWSCIISRIAFVSTYPPRACGVAAFTYDLATTLGEREIVALHTPGESGLQGSYGAEVHHRIRRDVQENYSFVARQLNTNGVRVVSVQYDPDIWGGGHGDYVLDFVRELTVPFVVTLHRADRDLTAEQAAILAELTDRASAVVVMSRAAQAVVSGLAGVDRSHIALVPYGVPALPLVNSDNVKARMGMQGKSLILSFGLMEPAKGIESVVKAMPAIVRVQPSTHYLIVGAPRPDLGESDREANERELASVVARSGVGSHVERVPRYVGRTELAKWLQAADLIVAPSTRMERTVSGTVALAMGAGKAIVATRSPYAAEQLTEGCGRLVAPDAPDEIAAAAIEILANQDLRTEMGRRAYERSRPMVWWKVAAEYRRIFERVADAGKSPPGRSVGRTPGHPRVFSQTSGPLVA